MKRKPNRGKARLVKGGKARLVKGGKARQLKKEAEEEKLKSLREACTQIDPGSVKLFQDLPISKETLLGLEKNNYIEPTEIQRMSLSLSLQGLDVLGAAKTGSGKTLAFIIPILELLNHKKWAHTDGIGALVITPTRELAYQIIDTLRKVGCHHKFSAGLIVGGTNWNFREDPTAVCNIIICTPGRLLQHMDENPHFTCDNLQILVLDEADRCLDMGFEKTMNSIIENLPVHRQTILFSATQTKSVRDLARLSLKDPIYVSVHEHAKHSTPEGLQQNYVVCELHEKINVLWSFIKSHPKQKILVFLSCCAQVKFHYEIFCRLQPGISLLHLRGNMNPFKRTKVYEEFRRKPNAVLLATDIASRGLDFPEVNWVLQVDCPEDANTYIHRAGRTARYHRGGESLLLLLPSEEEGMIQQLKSKKIPISKIRINPSKLHYPLTKMQALLAQDQDLKLCAQQAFLRYMRCVYLMKDKSIFNIHALDTDAYARSLGLAIPPRIRFLERVQKLQEQKTTKGDDNGGVGVLSKTRNSEDQKINYTETTAKNNFPEERKNITGFYQDDSENESGDDVLQLKRKDHDLDEILFSGPIGEVKELPKKNKKIITKFAVAKKILKKKIVANKKIAFNEEGEAIVNKMHDKVSELAKEYETENVGGIDIEKAKLVLKEEDKYDKQLFREKVKAKHREKKLKLKKGKMKKNEEEDDYDDEDEDEDNAEDGEDNVDDSDSGPDLSWLPDPDKIYGPKHTSDDVIDNVDGASSDNDDLKWRTRDDDYNNYEDTIKSPIGARLKSGVKRLRKQDNISKKVKRKVQETFDEQTNILADEELALHFLKNR